MRLRNKKTGAIGELRDIDLADGAIVQVETGHGECCGMIYATLAELNEEWEDYEEPKDDKYWYITDEGKVEFSSGIIDKIIDAPNDKLSRGIIGNCFSTYLEAENAVEKLKAWRWLKDNGVSLKYDKDKFILHIVVSGEISPNQWRTDGYMQKLDLLFGGEE